MIMEKMGMMRRWSNGKTTDNNIIKRNIKQNNTLSNQASIVCFIINVLFLSIIINTNISQAKQTRQVQTNDELLLEISKADITRLSVQNDKIQSLQFTNGILDVTIDTKLGEAYIKPKTNSMINLFVTTQKGFVYKLLLTPKSIPSEQIILQNKNTFISEGISQGISNDYERRITDIIISIQKELPIEGCFIQNLKHRRVKSPIKEIKLYAIEKYSCKDFTGYKFEIKERRRNAKDENLKDNNQTITESNFITKNTRAVKLYNNFLITINKE